ncbi:hypothetical protein FNV43_RR13755 [Rhamnella rubrinervis]|uniref:non-specific serine/threonine protein kinase n=1 Tax=Rhamnella rubrinervis TaxID=2594499 RepID=A0A8K0MFL0_9ROSA|nr:hypothetical protein FNV43_RR13755 [Rhamnella rubrinervis]
MLALLFLFLLFLSPPPILSVNQEGLYLLRFKHGLSDPNQSLSSWNDNDETPCNWFGISCETPALPRVTSVNLTGLELAGPFSSSICRLPFLSFLSLNNNSINTSIPADISDCQRLQHLDLAQNFLSGSIPDSLSEIPYLRYLDLSGNSITGGIPASFGKFRHLENLILLDNFLNGTIPRELGNISSLREFHLAYNPLSPGPLPSELGNLTNLEVLWLTGCNLVGQIPASLGRLTRLQNLDLSINRLSGSIPSSLTGLKDIIQIEFYNNSLSGKLPPGLSNLTTLRRFDASMNQLTGTIPSELCELPLGSLNLFENRFEGTLPESIARSPNLYELKLFNNKLSGELPRELGKNSPLESLDISYNAFYGGIPETLCEKGKLQDLILIYNSFSGKIPTSLGKCQSLRRVRLRNNKLSGTVPEKFWGLPHVYLFELAENSFSGPISGKISGAYNLSNLLISNNQFSGSMPHELGHLGNLDEFSGNDNKLTGQIPASFVKLGQLSKLDLSDNELSGEIPLSGKIPSQIGSLSGLNYLDLSSNAFSGKIPLELQNLKLNVLNLSNNQLSGELPALYANENYRDSFVGNPGLCGDLPDLCPRVSTGKNLGYLWILRSIFILAAIVFLVGVVGFYWKYRTFKKNKKGIGMSKWRSFHKLSFSEFEISGCLNEDSVIGIGASGKVYKVALSNGEEVAVKKLWKGTRKDDSSDELGKFEVEVETLGKIRHKNIVRLLCCCNSGDCKLLVYEFMPNGSLGDLLHSNKRSLLNWPRRYKIALDAAEGLSYLHNDCVPPIVHRDVKSNNILLDSEFGAKVADFGVAKVANGVSKGVETMSAIAGSCGYIAPEYGYTLRVNEKSDTYSFGVVILELVTGRLPVDPEFGEKDLVKWVCTTLDQKATADHVIDPILDPKHKEEIERVLEIGLLCTSPLPINRPPMRKVVKLLQEAGPDNKSRSARKDGKLSPYYYEDGSVQRKEDGSGQASIV